MASYIENAMGSGESVQCQATVSILSMLGLFVLGLVLLPFYGLGLLAWLAAYLRYISTELAVTNKKIIAKTGFIRRDTIEMLLPKVESVQVIQSLFGRVLNYGSVALIIVTATPAMPLPAGARAVWVGAVVGAPVTRATACAGAPARTAFRG
ncbi:PH domain-containing protein, partial [uncultured Thiodictyon sp.]|uniref:PH domain-containing protein n=1 Tax=uncultured Thiodictyon sp. TaxID=1846217 RepID=UPI0025FF734A